MLYSEEQVRGGLRMKSKVGNEGDKAARPQGKQIGLLQVDK